MTRGRVIPSVAASSLLILSVTAGCGGGGSGLGLPDGGLQNPPGSGAGGGAVNPPPVNPPPSSPGGESPVSPSAKQYRGNATVTVTQDSGFGSPAQQQTFTSQVRVLVDHPSQYRGVVEDNPFNLSIQPAVAEDSASGFPPRANGQFTLLTAHMAKDSAGKTSAMRQCWKLEAQGNAVSGVLLDNHHVTEEINTLNVPTEVATGVLWPWPALMGNGTRISGTVDENEVRLRIEGHATARRNSHPFTIEVSAARVR